MARISRRKFIAQSAIVTAGSMLIPSFITADDKNGILTDNNGKILVVIQLSGGNDGLNTIVPYANDLYYNSRPNLALRKGEYLKINDELGFNNFLSDFRSLYDDGLVSIFNNVGYPNPNRSHFRSMDIWHSASDSNEYINTGWLGRYLDAQCTDSTCHVEALEMNMVLSLALKGEKRKGLAIEDPQKLYEAVHNPVIRNLKVKDHPENTSLDYLYKTLAQASSSADYLFEKNKLSITPGTYPTTAFSNHLKQVSKFILAGANTKIYYVSLKGFDTHSNQKGRQEKLLTTYAQGVKAFVSELKQHNRLDDVLILTFSEFGRRVKENGSKGTDHGTANNLFIIGSKLKTPGIFNEAPDLSKLDQGDLIHSTDFRSIYTTITSKWLKTANKSVIDQRFDPLNFI